MNVFKIFMISFFSIVINFLKMKLTGNLWRKYFNILFTFLRTHMSQNHSSLSQSTSMLGIPNIRQKTLFSQVTLHPYLIKYLQFHRRMWEKLRIHLFIYHHLLLPHLLKIYAHIWTVIPMVVMWYYLLSLCPLVPLILQIFCVLCSSVSDL